MYEEVTKVIYSLINAYLGDAALAITGCEMGRDGADVVFVIDSSSSVLESDFDKVTDFLADFVGFFDPKDNNRVGAVVYANEPRAEINLLGSQNIGQLKTRLR